MITRHNTVIFDMMLSELYLLYRAEKQICKLKLIIQCLYYVQFRCYLAKSSCLIFFFHKNHCQHCCLINISYIILFICHFILQYRLLKHEVDSSLTHSFRLQKTWNIAHELYGLLGCFMLFFKKT